MVSISLQFLLVGLRRERCCQRVGPLYGGTRVTFSGGISRHLPQTVKQEVKRKTIIIESPQQFHIRLHPAQAKGQAGLRASGRAHVESDPFAPDAHLRL